MKHFCLIDGNNIAFASQLAALDPKSRAKRLYAGEQETTAINGVLQSAREIQIRYPKAQLLMLWDSGKAWRYQIYPEYKGNRKENPMIVEAKDALESQRDHFIPMGELIGVPQITAENFEADDIAAYLAKLLSGAGHKVTLVTRDQDWLQLVGPTVEWYDRFTDRTVSHVTFEAEIGYPSPAEFSEGKILCGDAGDNVSGIKGVGKVAASHLISTFGTVNRFLEEWEEWAVDNLVSGHPLRRAMKAINTFLADPDAAREKMDLNRKLMDLRIMYDNPELRAALHWKPTVINRAELKSRLAKLAFLRMATNLDEWLKPFEKQT